MTKRYYQLTLSAFMVVVTMVFFLWLVAIANAASLRICFVDPLPPPEVVTAPAFVNGEPFYPDLLPFSVLIDGNTRCSVIPIPPTLVRGVDQVFTMKYTNSLQEVSDPSTGKTFRAPPRPQQPVIESVSLVSP